MLVAEKIKCSLTKIGTTTIRAIKRFFFHIQVYKIQNAVYFSLRISVRIKNDLRLINASLNLSCCSTCLLQAIIESNKVPKRLFEENIFLDTVCVKMY